MYQILTKDDEVCIPSLSSTYSFSCTIEGFPNAELGVKTEKPTM